MEIEIREIIEFKSEMDMKEYLQLLGWKWMLRSAILLHCFWSGKNASNQAANATSIKGNRSE